MPRIQRDSVTISMVLFVPTTIAFAQIGGAEEADSSWVGVVTAESANVRCGANESYYTIESVEVGDMVRVHGKRQDWMKIDTSGSVFEDTIGYIKYPASNTSLFEVAGTSGTVRGELEVLARNIESEELYRSWRPVLQLQEGDTVIVLESTMTEPGTLHRDAYMVHTVQMPANATCWINASSITEATPEQEALFEGTGTGVLEAKLTTSTNDVSDSMSAETSPTTVVEEESVEEVVQERLEPLTLVELEAAWEKMADEAVMGAEVTPLRDMYTELLAENSNDIVIDQIASGRIKQLGVWEGLQNQRVRIENLRMNMAIQTGEVEEFQSVMSLYGNYALAGRLALSNTFDGRLRPFMYRIQDVKSGRTLGYLPANEDWGLPNLIGQTIGVVGTNKWDPNWSVSIVEVERFDILSPTTATVSPDIQ